ncbi:ankyrin repeat domain-containing protein 50-like isoform X3 [Xenopus tropicalis]|uniref:Ankyrin repeat domain-containing protein 50-like isoform X3 n=1 Tax=Xenopus tropicalis TaxID=8364 RepID=A0A8J1J5Z5_XENTR|nr:ankyrin repeat domain-containing protein 50-like isoform X3 [Xenopus tropicalis]
MTPSKLRGRPFYCREWALQRLQHCLEGLGGTRTPGILITGAPGAGKTALCAEILWPSSEAGCCSRLSSRVLAYHFCQAHTHASLCPHQFIQSLAQQLRESPLISGYNADTEACQGDLDEAFKRLLLLPLLALPAPTQNLFLLVDSLDETCSCCQSEGFPSETNCSIAELLANHHELLPPWLLLVCSARRQNKAVSRMFTGFRRLCLDDLRKAHIVRDVQQYILCRLDREEALRQHLTLDTAEMLNQLHIKSNGCFLYLERVLDGVAEGSILLREIRHIPGTLNGLYLWLCQRLFSGKQFYQAQALLNVLLASPRPLSASELRGAAWTKQMQNWSERDFEKSLESISGLLRSVDEPQGSQVLFHHSFSEWLLDVKYCTQKYLCNVSEGHSMLAMTLSTRAQYLQPNEVHQLARHLLLCDLRGLEPSHLALWLLWTGVPVSDCLVSDIPLELDVLQLLLLAGAHLDGSCDLLDSDVLRKTLEKGASVELLLENGAGLHQRDRNGRTLLAAAAHAGNLEAVKLMLSMGADLETTDEDGQTPLGLAAHQGHLAIVQLLLSHGAQPDHPDNRGWTPLRSAAWGGHTEIVEALLSAGAQPDVCGSDGRTALRAAAWGGHEGAVKALLKAGAQADHADPEGRTPLMAASYMGHRPVAKLFLDAGVDVNRSDSEGRTALAVACLCIPAGRGYPELISLLLEHRADTELPDGDGMTPLLVAAYEGQAEVAELLLEAGADPDRAGRGRMTPLLAAALGGHAETVRVLLLWGAATDATDTEGRSALGMAASAARGEEAVRVLLERGLDENHRDQLGWAPLHWAACEGRRNSCRALVDGGAKVSARDREGCTPLHLAAQEGHTSSAELLINRGAPIDQRDADGRTALCLAALGDHRGPVELLLRKGADPNVKDSKGVPLLQLLVLQGQMAMVELLVEQGADIEGQDPEQRTALHAACWQGNWEMAQLLLVKGKAQPNAPDKDRRTPLHCATWRGHPSIARLLLQHKAFPDAQCSQGATPLCIAAQEGHEDLARVLLEEGKAYAQHADNYGRTPVRVAAKGGHLAIVHLLVSHGAPPYQGPMGQAPEKRTPEKKPMCRQEDSWSTLSPVSTGSCSMENSLKSSQGSILTSSTYHSQATVPMDSLTFTQQVQQHSLPRSRSRQAIALTGMINYPVPQGASGSHLARPSAMLHQTSSSFQDLGAWEGVGGHNQFSCPSEYELKRNCILTNPKYGSPKYPHAKTGDSGFSLERNGHNVSSPGGTRVHMFSQHQTGSSGYSSRGTVSPGEVREAGDPLRSALKCGVPVYPPRDEVSLYPTKKAANPVSSPKKMGNPRKGGEAVLSHKIIPEPTHSPRKVTEPTHSPRKVTEPTHSPRKVTEPTHSPRKVTEPTHSPWKVTEPSHSPRKVTEPTHSPWKVTEPPHSPRKVTEPTHSPWKVTEPPHSPWKVTEPPHSPRKVTEPSHSPRKVTEPSHSPWKVTEPPYSPWKVTEPPYSPWKVTEPPYSPWKVTEPKHSTPNVPQPKRMLEPDHYSKKIPESINSFQTVGEPMDSPRKSGEPHYSPRKMTEPIHSPRRTGHVVYSPRDPSCSPTKTTDTRMSPLSPPTDTPGSPVISITTMDPQLHLKQAIKLQFEGRTCGFNYRKETPL